MKEISGFTYFFLGKTSRLSSLLIIKDNASDLILTFGLGMISAGTSLLRKINFGPPGWVLSRTKFFSKLDSLLNEALMPTPVFFKSWVNSS